MKEKVYLRALLLLALATGAALLASLPALAGEDGCPAPGVDADADGICDDVDNCLGLENPLQEDADGDGAGDACDACDEDPEKTDPGVCGCGVADEDADEDALLDCDDNCPFDANADQADADTDGVGDVCDECAESALGGTVVIEKCDSLVENLVAANGCSFMDDVATCVAEAGTHGKFVSCMARSSKAWARQGLLAGRDRSRVIICAARSDVGRDLELRGD